MLSDVEARLALERQRISQSATRVAQSVRICATVQQSICASLKLIKRSQPWVPHCRVQAPKGDISQRLISTLPRGGNVSKIKSNLSNS